ncbi:hypothetical protein [Streptococcus cuniculi]|uniref:Uncharacterized protein n=1 Tax=Streptococcus cuniculi TaxID=1432788 RepID=A0A4Y9JCG7_9STRE|nr:hypothetical protein [Streptococcus cuniculi]MBF0777969.1 hypothetical protein [Streptococcus cuniculi]TFU98261.1 hypothetical protein E4T82_04465 [Streptococcus cuniculi]
MKYRKRILSSLLLSVLLLSTIPAQAVETGEGIPASKPSASIEIADTDSLSSEVSSSATDTSLTALPPAVQFRQIALFLPRVLRCLVAALQNRPSAILLKQRQVPSPPLPSLSYMKTGL